MLDSDTKRRINTCRDILVGKVPDPKSQVEQITIALIYKFMDDMDLQAEEMGFARKFFTGEYERYAWAKLVAPGIGGQEMLNTYSEALTKMVENEQLPELFRSIFRNAYLPYRDPETLRSFLREINGFTYDHSEKLGDAFEYLLSVLGSQGDAGQFRTPRHIIDFMVEIIDPKKEEVILDPACGTAGFLISSYKHILKANSTVVEPVGGNGEVVDAAEAALESPLRYAGDLLTPEDRKRLADNIKGYDISPDMVRLSLVNLYLHGFADPKIDEYDSLVSEDKWGQTADVILANPPFMSPKGGIPVHRRFAIQSKRSEVLFVDYIAEHLNPNGRAAIVVPEGIIFQSQSAYCELRKMLVGKFLVAVISLPAGVFNPYSGVKTSILILDRAVAKASDSVAFFKIENDGFGLGAQRRAVKGGQLGQVKAELGAWLAALRSDGEAVLKTSLGFAVEKKRIAEDGEFNLSGERYRETTSRHSAFPFLPLAEFCELASGNPAPQGDEHFEGGTHAFIRTSDVGRVHLSATFAGSADKLTDQAIEKLKLKRFPAKTILFPKSGASTFLNHRVMLAEPAYVSSHLACIIPDETKAVPDYVYHLLCQIDARSIVPDQAYPSLRISELGAVEIPLPPLEMQREIVAEIEGYQKVIDGARIVLENYRPHIPIDPTWPMIELGTTGAIMTGPFGTALHESDYVSDGVPVINPKNIVDGSVSVNGIKQVSPATITRLSEFCVHASDIIIGRRGEMGRCAVISNNADGWLCGTGCFTLRPNVDCDPAFLHLQLSSGKVRSYLDENAVGVTMKNLNQSILSSVKIPLPPLETQQAIVAEIEAEQALVAANRSLIARFGKKIETAIARVWGGAEEAAAA
jgi:type I restriction enzyme M protein